MIENKHALVTGGSRGIGLAVAQLLHARGAKVSVLSRSAGNDNDDFHRVRADLTDPEDLAQAFAVCRQANGPIAILVNNAGIAESAPFKRTGRSMWDRALAINLTGTYLCTRAVLDEMLAQGWGRIINVASIAGLQGAPYVSAYAASKHGVLGLTRSLAAELEGSGVTVNAVCPGYTDTPMLRASLENIAARTRLSPDEARSRLAASNPGGRIATAGEVARAVLDLCCGDENGAERIVPAPQ